MAVRDVETLIKEAVEAFLVEQTEKSPGTSVTYHVSAITSLEHDDGEEDGQPGWLVTMRWYLCLYITNTRGAYMRLSGHLPYDPVSHGDLGPVLALLHELWEHAQFALLMVEENFDHHLDHVADEVERGK